MKLLVVCKHPKGSDGAECCELINGDFEVRYAWKNVLMPEELDGIDIVVSIGGDGTALSASHFLTKRPLLAVNSDPKKSEGALTTLTVKELDGKLKQISEGKFKTENLERIEVLINGKLQNPLALNEVFIANEKAYLMSRYKIKVENGERSFEEEQKSSGLIFSTGTGSTAWFKSAGGKPFSAQARHIEMIVREPYVRKLNKFKKLKCKIDEKGFAEIYPETEMVLAIDSIREIRVTPKDVVKIRISGNPLSRII